VVKISKTTRETSPVTPAATEENKRFALGLAGKRKKFAEIRNKTKRSLWRRPKKAAGLWSHGKNRKDLRNHERKQGGACGLAFGRRKVPEGLRCIKKS